MSYGLYRLPGQSTNWKSKRYRLTIETRSAASHLSAGILTGLGRPAELSPGYAEASGPGRSRRAPEFAHRFYRCASLDRGTWVMIDGIPCLPVDRTLLDIAAEHGTEPFARCFNEAVRRRLTSHGQLTASFEREPKRRKGTAAIRAALDAVDGSIVAMSDWSQWAADALVHAGLPEPELEHVVRDGRGQRIAQVDLAWPGYGLVVELDSRRYHFDDRAFARDRRRDARLAGLGMTVVRITWEQYQDRSYFVGVVREALVRRGLRT